MQDDVEIVDFEKVDEIIEDRSQIVYSLIAKQNQKNIFPILAYSYYEYANSLKENDKYSALLYLEYALELGNLDIYFPKKGISLSFVKIEHVILYSSGLITGIIVGIIMLRMIQNYRKTWQLQLNLSLQPEKDLLAREVR